MVVDGALWWVILLGNTHHGSPVPAAALRTAADEDCDVLVRVGDVWLQDSKWRGYCPQHAGFMYSSVHVAIPLVIIDGNHEVWRCPTRVFGGEDTAGVLSCRRQLHLGGPLRWADCGSIWTWSGRPLGVLGGSASNDLQKDYVNPSKSHTAGSEAEGRNG